jgi:hypothetical protein
MASPAASAFHAEKMAAGKRSVAIRIENGTKATTPRVISYHRQHRAFNGIPTNPLSSGARLFFVNNDETHKPFASEMKGGVIQDFRLAKKLLDQRARSSANIDLASQGLEPNPSPLLELDAVESRSLELNNQLQQLQDAVEAGEITSSLVPELKNTLRLFVALIPTFTGKQLADFQEFFGNMINILEDKAAQEHQPVQYGAAAAAAGGRVGLTPSENQVYLFIRNLYEFIRQFAPSVDLPRSEKEIVARAIVKKVFGIRLPRDDPDVVIPPEPAEPAGAAPAALPVGDAAAAFDDAYAALATNLARAQVHVGLQSIMNGEARRYQQDGDVARLRQLWQHVLRKPFPAANKSAGWYRTSINNSFSKKSTPTQFRLLESWSADLVDDAALAPFWARANAAVPAGVPAAAAPFEEGDMEGEEA